MNTREQPNLVLILTDHFRGDCLSRLGHPDAETPHLDALSAEGYCFSNCYSPCPSCIPARRSLMTGQTAYTQGFVGYKDNLPWDYETTLAGEITRAGYQTINIGKTHFFPPRKHLGFEQIITPGDYDEWLKNQPAMVTERSPHGILNNSWMARPHPFPETHMEETWLTTRALEFFAKRDTTRPFFLCLSFNGPHPPWTPPQAYWDLFVNRNFQPPAIGNWATRHAEEARYPLDPNAWRGKITDSQMHRASAGYFAYLNYIDAQVGRLINHMKRSGLYDHTALLFTSDHGEMLGDHNLWRKTYAYEGSAHVPMIVKPPKGVTSESVNRVLEPVIGWEDIMPTLLDFAGEEIPECVEGKSMLPLMHDASSPWREYYHGEHSTEYHPDNACQYLTDGHWKFIWNPNTGEEQLFHLDPDPREKHDLATLEEYADTAQLWRSRLIHHLKDREEGLSDGEKLICAPVPPVRGQEPKTEGFE